MSGQRGYYGIAFWEPKFKENIGTAIRSAHCFGVDFIAIIGRRYKRQSSDTLASEKHIPVYEYDNLKDFLRHVPVGCAVIGVERDGLDITDFSHPDRAVYLFGGEDRSVPKEIKTRIKIPTNYCLNLAVASSILMFDRQVRSI